MIWRARSGSPVSIRRNEPAHTTLTSPVLRVDDTVNQCFGNQRFGNVWQAVSGKKVEPQITQMSANEARINGLSKLVIGCALVVANTHGSGFVEKVYENALAHELRKRGLAVGQQHGVIVTYDGAIVGEYATDLLVEDTRMVWAPRET
jgi:hypothetical protein